jgi:SAM-dependent methyltransferase
MIKVLQDWQEVGEATKWLCRRDLPRHATGEKNWDLRHLCELVASLPRDARVVDLGSSGVNTLKVLHAMGFKNLRGVDLDMRWSDRARQVVQMWRERTLKPPYRLSRGDLMRTRFRAESFDVATCISVIEHGVDVEKFWRECRRILRPGGLLYVTTDYWQDKIDLKDDPGAFGLSWRVFSREEIEHFIKLGGNFGFSLYEEAVIPKCRERCVVYHQQEFTFVAMGFKKSG